MSSIICLSLLSLYADTLRRDFDVAGLTVREGPSRLTPS